MKLQLDDAWRVVLEDEVWVPLSRQDLWREISDLETYACLDHFHRRFEIGATEPAVGVPVRIPHGLLFDAFERVGRILVWKPGEAWVFSDLSRRRPGVGFPHVYGMRIFSEGTGLSRLEIRIVGRWTARALPRSLVRLWLGWSLMKIAATARVRLLAAVLRRVWPSQGRRVSAGPPPRCPDSRDRPGGRSRRRRRGAGGAPGRGSAAGP